MSEWHWRIEALVRARLGGWLVGGDYVQSLQRRSLPSSLREASYSGARAVFNRLSNYARNSARRSTGKIVEIEHVWVDYGGSTATKESFSGATISPKGRLLPMHTLVMAMSDSTVLKTTRSFTACCSSMSLCK